MAESKPTKESFLKQLNEKAGRKDYFEAREVETEDGMVTQIISGGGSLVLQANGTGDAVWKKLQDEYTGVVDPGSNPTEAVEDDKQFFSKDGNVAFPTQPEAIEATAEPTEVNPKADREAADTNSRQANAQPQVRGRNANEVESATRGATTSETTVSKSSTTAGKKDV